MSSEALVAQGLTVVVFYPGAVSQPCTNQLAELSYELDAFAARGANIVAISADPGDVSRDLARQLGIGFPLLEDAGGSVTRSYTALEVDGTAIPVVFIIKEDGTLFQARPEPHIGGVVHAREILAAVDQAKPPATAMPGLRGGFRPLERIQVAITAGGALDYKGWVGPASDSAEVGVSGFYPLGSALLIGPAVHAIIGKDPVMDLSLAVKFRWPDLDGIFEYSLIPQFGLSVPLIGDADLGWHAGGRFAFMAQMTPDWAISFNLGVIYEDLGSAPRRGGVRVSAALGVAWLL